MKKFAKCKGVWYRNTQSAARGFSLFVCLFFLFNQVDSSSHAGMQKFMALARPAVVGKKKVSERASERERERGREREKEKERERGREGRRREWKNDYNSNKLQLERPKFDNGCCYWLRSLIERRSLLRKQTYLGQWFAFCVPLSITSHPTYRINDLSSHYSHDDNNSYGDDASHVFVNAPTIVPECISR